MHLHSAHKVGGDRGVPDNHTQSVDISVLSDDLQTGDLSNAADGEQSFEFPLVKNHREALQAPQETAAGQVSSLEQADQVDAIPVGHNNRRCALVVDHLERLGCCPETDFGIASTFYKQSLDRLRVQ
jgi:hypothetical protein